MLSHTQVNGYESIAATIQFHRPDLPIPAIKDANAHDEMPLNPPFDLFSSILQRIVSKCDYTDRTKL